MIRRPAVLKTTKRTFNSASSRYQTSPTRGISYVYLPDKVRKTTGLVISNGLPQRPAGMRSSFAKLLPQITLARSDLTGGLLQ